MNKQKTTNKYLKEYNSVSSKEEFIKLLNKKYKVKKITALRRYYDCKKIVQMITIPIIKQSSLDWKYNIKEKEVPHPLKIIMIKDMIRLKIKINRELLQRHGFNNLEINWLEDEKYITLE